MTLNVDICIALVYPFMYKNKGGKNMKRKAKIIISSSILVTLIIIGVLMALFYTQLKLYFMINKNDYQGTDSVLSDTNISDEKVLQIICENGLVIDDQMAQVIAQNCIGNTKRFETLVFLSTQKGDALLINNDYALFSYLKSYGINWNVAETLLTDLINVNITDQNGENIISASLSAINGYKAEDVGGYLDVLFSKDIEQLYDIKTIQSIMTNTLISDEQILQIIKDNEFPLSDDMAEGIARSSIENAGRYEALSYISKKFEGKIKIEGENAIFKSLDEKNPNWEATAILLVDLTDANIVDSNNICLLSRAIIAANTSEGDNIDKFFDALFEKEIYYWNSDNERNSPFHYAFIYENKTILNKLFTYMNTFGSKYNTNSEYYSCSVQEFVEAYNIDNLTPWEFAGVDISTAINCLNDFGWFYIETMVADWGINNNKIDTEACIKVTDYYENESATYENVQNYSAAMEYLQNALDFINYAIDLEDNKDEKDVLKEHAEYLSIKYNNLVIYYEEMMTPRDINGKELYLGAKVGYSGGGTMYIGEITEFNADNSKAKIYYYGKLNSWGGFEYYTSEEKNNVFSIYIFGAPIDGWYDVSVLELMN